MRACPHWLLEHASDTHSQAGEDGVIRKALETLPERNQWCVEFGAWDGRYLSNTLRLIEEESYRAILIEADEEKYQILVENFRNEPRVCAVNAFVGFGNRDSLDQILDTLAGDIPLDFDFLSIDIDGNDYHAWRAMSKYRPKLVCIEFNSTIPTEVDFVQDADNRVSHGASVTAISRLAKTKGYELVCVLGFNAFFVDEKYFQAFGIEDNSVATLRKDLSAITWFFSGYDGSVHLAGFKELPWHGVKFDADKVQVLPRLFRRFPVIYPRFHNAAFKFYKKWNGRGIK